VLTILKRGAEKKVEQKWVNLERDIESLIDGNSQTDATFQTTRRYSRISAKKGERSPHYRKKVMKNHNYRLDKQ